MSRLKRLAAKRRILGISRKPEYTLEDALIGSMKHTVDTLAAFHAAAGEPITTVRLSDGSSVDMQMPEGVMDWDHRLQNLYSAAELVAGPESYDLMTVVDAMLQADGWILNKYTLKSPAWMVPHVEVAWGDLPETLLWVKHVQDWRESAG
jgi:hypothetical protein